MNQAALQHSALHVVDAAPVPLLVDGLAVGYRTRGSRGPTDTVRDVSFQVGRGETVSLVGQSGSGKSTIARAVAGLLPGNGSVTAGRVAVAGHEVADFSRKQWSPLRGSTLGFIPQDPLSSLDPLQRIGVQIAQAVQVAGDTPRSEVPARVIELLEHVGIRQASARVRSYPHELSGGQLQRVLIAIAIAARPKLLIADEPTSALDVTVQRRILDLLDGLRQELGLGILFITHDLALAQERSDAIVVLQDGNVRESGPAEKVLLAPRHPYTVGLLSDSPASSPLRYRERIRAAAEQVQAEQRGETNAAPAVVEVSHVSKRYGRDHQTPPALDEASLVLRPRSIHALVGESGSGKSTLARIVAGLTSFDDGSVRVAGRELPGTRPSPTPSRATSSWSTRTRSRRSIRGTPSDRSSRSPCGSMGCGAPTNAGAASRPSSTRSPSPRVRWGVVHWRCRAVSASGSHSRGRSSSRRRYSSSTSPPRRSTSRCRRRSSNCSSTSGTSTRSATCSSRTTSVSSGRSPTR